MSGDGFTTDGDDYIDCGNDSSLRFTTQSFTLLIWFKSSTAATQILIQKDTKVASTPAVGYGLYLRSSNPYFKVFVTDGTTFVANDVCATNPADGGWHFCAGTFNSVTDTVEVFIDTVSQDTEVAGVAIGSIDDASTTFEIGRDINLGAPQYYFTGSIDEVWAYNRALTTTEMLHIYNTTKGRFS